ncbi:hypothetical protein CDD81_4471 [Ophiocordyceps australis]|uniref:chitinase n=1 Tax=Ophiocordyceps australis TaxID=1399860 RepID=A0A2C5YH88_9HYPO|nr:hypothetical protein CDD81_4471 [Ophiocordyceps australis]
MLNYGCINRVYYAYADVMLDGSVFLSDEWADARASVDGRNGGLGSLLHLRHERRFLQVILSIGGPNASSIFPIVASSTRLRDEFGSSVAGLVNASGLDGIDIAWQYPSDAEQGRNFLALLAAVRIHLSNDKILTAVLPANEDFLRLIDLAMAAEYLNTINLAAYDFYGPLSRCTGHHAQLYAMSSEEPSGAAAVHYITTQGFPAKNILLGVPTYGRSFLEATGPGQGFRGSGGHGGAFEYKKLPRPGSREVVDRRRIAAQCVGTDCGFVTYDNPETVKAKANLCMTKGLGGLFYSNVLYDSSEGPRSLIRAGFCGLHTEP